MSDFLFSRKPIEKGKLSREIQSIYDQAPPKVIEYHGRWGTLAVSQNLYKAFQSYETEQNLMVVIGGPVLTFQSNDFILDNDISTIGTKAIYNRWENGTIKWDEDLDGPFVILVINKENGEVLCVTDIMSFIPVYSYGNSSSLMLGTHIDALAATSNQIDSHDIVSHVDFILHGVVTYPYTTYERIYQIAPASEHYSNINEDEIKTIHYWEPNEDLSYQSINKAAKDINRALASYVKFVTENAETVGQFISGGEDSRLLSAILPKEAKRDAYIFLDNMNREGKVAQRAADAYDAELHVATRSKLHYLSILPACVDMVGNGSQYFHAHTFGFHNSCELTKYDSVFGGLFSDALLKGARIKKIRGTKRFPFLPQIKNSSYSAGDIISNSILKVEILEQVTMRRQEHLKFVKQYRNESADEWFEMWPISMNMNIPNLHVNRRLFRSYEPFLANKIVKISASVPQKWKLNRRLFHKLSKQKLRQTKWLSHSDGRLPYFAWYINSFIQFTYWIYEKIGRKVGYVKGNQGPWGEWDFVLKSNEWKECIEKYSQNTDDLIKVFNNDDIMEVFKSNNLNYVQKINLMQTLYSFSKETSIK